MHSLSIIITKHSRDCEFNEWSGIIERSFWGNYNANEFVKQGGHHKWYVVKCNDPTCKGRKAVHSSVLKNA